MEIVDTLPPNIGKIVKRFGQTVLRHGVVFTYGKFIHNPSKIFLPVWIKNHEEVHWERQMNTSPEQWWENYIDDDDYRYNEELLAHQREYAVFTAFAKSRNERRLGLKTMAKRLSGDIYGNCVDFETAKWNIKNA